MCNRLCMQRREGFRVEIHCQRPQRRAMETLYALPGGRKFTMNWKSACGIARNHRQVDIAALRGLPALAEPLLRIDTADY